MAGITITRDRGHVLDFSYPMFSAGLEVMTTRRGSPSNWLGKLASFVTAGVWRYLLALLVDLIIAGGGPARYPASYRAIRRRTQLGYLAGVGLAIQGHRCITANVS
ncbi:MAG TPA: hypothetical protein VF788_11405 [Pseudonocardiaceae bacterium]